MNTQHTPGPWQPFTRYVTANGRFIAKAFEANDTRERPGFAAGQEPQQSQAQAEADARLIAAAPELLAALENLLSRAALPGPARKNAVLRERMISAREQARAAIAKATGGVQ
jgi:hypothetical protein